MAKSLVSFFDSRCICPADDYVSDVKLPTVHNLRDLGVHIISHLTFRDHINSIVFREHLRSIDQCTFGAVFYAKMLLSSVKLFTTY